MTKKNVLAIVTGGTIFQKANAGKMDIAVGAKELIDAAGFDGHVDIYDTKARSGAELTFQTLIAIRDKILETQSLYDGFLIISGTDSMEELAFGLDLLLDIKQPVVITGAMKPADMLGYDGLSNIDEALKVIIEPQSSNKGVLVCMNSVIHLARYVRKLDTALMHAFTSHPGAIGEIRSGQIVYYYNAVPKIKKYTDIDTEKLYTCKVPIWMMTISPYFPYEMLDNCDGLVIAAMGTGAIPTKLMNNLSELWTERLPIILSTRCVSGFSYDDFAYKGSKDKYQDKGFIIDGYEHLNPLQARLKLCLELSL